MKLHLKFAMGFTFITSLIWIVGITSIIVTKNNIKKTIERYSIINNSRIAQYLNKDFFSKIEYFQGRTKGAQLQKDVKESNTHFSKIKNPINTILLIDKQWVSSTNNKLSDNLIKKALSESFKEEIKVFEQEKGYKIVTEILVTDSLGAMVAQTGKASDYYQADEYWWQKAKQDGLYLTGFNYDESSKTYSSEICVRIEDNEKRFIGVLKAVISIEILLNNLKDYLTKNQNEIYFANNYFIINNEGKILFSRDSSYKFLTPYPFYSKIKDEIQKRNYYVELSDNANKTILAFFTKIPDYKNLLTLDWYLISEYYDEEIFSSINILKKQIIYSCIAITLIGLLVSFLITKKILTPLKKLTFATEGISEGNYDMNIDIESKDEIAELGKSFNDMTQKIKEYRSKLLLQNQELQKEIEEREKTEKKFRELFNNSTLGIFRSTLEGKFTDVNPAAAKMFKYNSPEEMINSITDIPSQIYLDPNDRNKIIEKLKSTNDNCIFETKFKTKDGSIIIGNLHISLRKDENENYFLEGFVENITEKKLAEINFQKIFDSNPEWIAISRYETGQIEIVNKAFTDTLGYKLEDIVAKTVKDLNIYFNYSDRDKILLLLQENQRLSNLVIKLRKQNSQIISCLVSFEKITYRGNECLISIGRDISERILWEEELAKEKERLSVTLRSIGDGVITTDINGNITLLNRIAEKLTGWKFEEAFGKHIDDVFKIIDAETREARESPFKKVINTNLISEIENNTLLVSKDGTERLIADSGSPIKDKESKVIGVVIVFRDITQRRKFEEEVQKMQKIESIGVLAGGLAHDFNNILTSIIGSIELGLIKNETEHKNKYLRIALNAAVKAKGITQQLLTFAKGGEPIKKITSLKDVVRTSASFASSGSNCEIEIDIEKNLWYADIDEGQISQVINNMVINAIQAMPDGGKVKIKLYNHEIIGSHNKDIPSKYVVIKISDSGIGIDKSIINKIFDPYFTTKKQGSGLGLAISYSIIKKHNGFIEVNSEPKKGSEFIIYLPAVESNILDNKDNTIIDYKAKGYILIMDDEDSVRSILSDILVFLGYEVDTATNGIEVIEKYSKAYNSQKPYDLVIMDLTIPGGMGGKETIEKLLVFDPNAKALVFSGYSNDPVMSDYKKYGFCGTISKPYRVDEVKSVLKKIFNNE